MSVENNSKSIIKEGLLIPKEKLYPVYSCKTIDMDFATFNKQIQWSFSMVPIKL